MRFKQVNHNKTMPSCLLNAEQPGAAESEKKFFPFPIRCNAQRKKSYQVNTKDKRTPNSALRLPGPGAELPDNGE